MSLRHAATPSILPSSTSTRKIKATKADAGLLAQPAKNAAIVAGTRRIIEQYCGHDLPIFVTETNSVNTQPGKQSVSQVNALFAADDILSFLEGGAANVDWWQLHNGSTTNANNSPQLFSDATYGDYGILADGSAGEPTPNTPQRTYYGFAMVHDFAVPGDTLVKATSDEPMIAVHTVKNKLPHGSRYNVLIINKSATQSFSIIVGDNSAHPVPIRPTETFSPSVQTPQGYGIDQISPSPGDGFDVPPYSITLVSVE